MTSTLAVQLFPPPHYPTFILLFGLVLEAGTSEQPFYSLEALPKGIISHVIISDPLVRNFSAETLADYRKKYFYEGRSVLDPNNRPPLWNSWAADVATINPDGKFSIFGPHILAPGLEAKGQFMTLRLPLFFPDDGLWGFPNYTATVCPESVCKQTRDGRNFMGFIQSRFPWQPFLNSLNTLKTNQGLSYSLFAIDAAVQGTTDQTNHRSCLAISDPPPNPSESVCTLITLLDSMTWQLCVYAPRGWTPLWTGALFAVFTLLALAISVLLFFVLRSRAQAFVFLARQQEMNKQLQIDKAEIGLKHEELEALTVRQFELLKHFAGRSDEKPRLTPQQSKAIAVDDPNNFEEMIRSTKEQLASMGAAQMAEEGKITLISPLGYGSYGTVHLGEWHGAQVAVKRMILPHSMSSLSRASTMAVMEVSISSSVTHPNLVQLYTYRVSPITQGDRAGAEASVSNGLYIESLAARVSSPRTSETSEAVAAYELLLVLEYCDGGSLRGVLDGSPISYLTCLSFAMDIAKGVLHLHLHSVLHLDLKAANILLKTVGKDGAVAKVCYFLQITLSA